MPVQPQNGSLTVNCKRLGKMRTSHNILDLDKKRKYFLL